VIPVLEGTLILLVGILIGICVRSLPGKRRNLQQVKPVCGCEHHYSMHDPKTGACHSEITVTTYDEHGLWNGRTYRPCTCRQYSGPEPLPSYYAPEIAGEETQS
jgi:hypothetical protein